jgi:lauroyl/myristoyl acyltransferase
MVSLARMSGAAILPILCLEREDGKASLILEEAIRVGDDDDRERQIEGVLSRYAELMERYIHRDPASYRSWHMAARVHDAIIRNEVRLR